MSLVILDPPQEITSADRHTQEHIWRSATFEKFLFSIKFHNNFIQQQRPFVIACFIRFELYGELVECCQKVFGEGTDIQPLIW